MLARFLPLAGMFFFLAVTFARVWLQQRRYGNSGFVLFRGGSRSQYVRDAGHVAILVLFLIQSVLHAISPESLAMMSFQAMPVTEVFQAIGAALVLSGTLLMLSAQLGMGKSWRIGIDPLARPGLVTSGLYRFSRNPIYVATFLAMAGFQVLLPTWLSFVLVGMTISRIRAQVREEEAYLTGIYGDEYLAYARVVGRFVPGLGRLAVP